MKSPAYRPNLSLSQRVSDNEREILQVTDGQAPPSSLHLSGYSLSKGIQRTVDVILRAEATKKEVETLLTYKPVSIKDARVRESLQSIQATDNPATDLTYDDYKRAQEIIKDPNYEADQKENAKAVLSYFEDNVNDLLGFAGLEGLFVIEHIIKEGQEHLTFITDENFLSKTKEQKQEFLGRVEQLEKERVDRHQELTRKLQKLEDDLSRTQNDTDRRYLEQEIKEMSNEIRTLEVSMKTSSEMSYLSHTKANASETLLEETRHLANYTMWNHMGGTMDCAIEAIVDLVIDKNFIIKFDKLGEVIRVLKMAQAFVGFQFQGLKVDLDAIKTRLLNQVPPWAREPQRELLRMLFKLQDSVTLPVIELLKEAGNTDSFSENRFVQCVPLAELSNMLVDQLLKAEKMAKRKMADLFKYQSANTKETEAFLLQVSERDKLRKLYQALGLAIEFLEQIESRTIIPNKEIQTTIQQFLRDKGAYTYYDASTGKIIYS